MLMRGVLVLILLLHAPAWSYPCPADLESTKNKKVLHDWLMRLKGHRMIEGCQIEITACNPEEPRSNGQTLGELFLIDNRSREVYLPLTIAEPKDSKIRTSLEAYPKSFFYIKWDYYYEEEFGRTETYRLDIRMTKDGQGMRSLDLGTYSTNKALNGSDGNQSRWYNCGESFEYN